MAVIIFLPPSIVIHRAVLRMSTWELMTVTMRLKTLMMNYCDKTNISLAIFIWYMIHKLYNTQHIIIIIYIALLSIMGIYIRSFMYNPVLTTCFVYMGHAPAYCLHGILQKWMKVRFAIAGLKRSVGLLEHLTPCHPALHGLSCHPHPSFS